MDDFDKTAVKSALESMMFVWGEPLDPASAAQVCGIKRSEAVACFKELMEEYESEGRGILIRSVDGKYQFCTRYENNSYIEQLCMPVRERKLSQSALEVLAIIAYKQPATRVDIEAVRGVKSDRAIETLVKKELIEEKGRSESVGKPILYGTTKLFLEKFGISRLNDLPKIDDIEAAVRSDDSEEESLDLLSEQMQIEI